MKKIKEFIKSKGGFGIVIGTLSFLAVGGLCIILGYGFGSGWDVVAAFFTSKWATPVYLCVIAWLFLMAYIFYYKYTKGE